MQHDRLKVVRDSTKLRQVSRGLPEHEIEIERGDGRTLERGRGIADQDGVEAVFGQETSGQLQERLSGHARM